MEIRDKGSQLEKILGDTKDYWSEKLGGKTKVFKNLASCQYRNVCERKVRTFKRFLKMGIMGCPGPQTSNIKLELYMTILEQATHALNSTPFLSQENFELLSPSHFITPWYTSQVSIRELPESNMPELKKARYKLMHLSWKINEIMREEICMDLERWKQSRLKLSKNNGAESVKLGDMVMIRRTNKHDAPQFGLVTSIENQGRNSAVQLR